MGNTLAAIAEGSMAPLLPARCACPFLYSQARRTQGYRRNRLRKDAISGPLCRAGTIENVGTGNGTGNRCGILSSRGERGEE